MFFAERIEDGLGISLVSTERERLHGTAQRLRFVNGSERRERSVQGRNAAPVEAPAMAARALAGQGSPGPLWIVCPVDQSAKAHQACTNSGVAASRDSIEIGMDMIGSAFA